jgi:hypothetical protein
MKRINFLFFLSPKIPQNSPQNPLNPNSCEITKLKLEYIMIVKFVKTGDLYKVLEENSEMKHPESRNWIPSIVYQQYKKLVGGEYQDISDPKIFVRERKEFLERFLPVFDF